MSCVKMRKRGLRQVSSTTVLFFVLLVPLQPWAQVTSNVFRRVFLIQVGDATATAFTIDVDGRQYLITAKHVVAALGADGLINIRKNDRWLPLKVKVLRCDDPIDIAVLVPPEQLSVTWELPADSMGAQFGQEVYFVGFPYDVSSGYFTNDASANGGFPVGFIKKATLSGLHNANNANWFYLDGHNNPGFSGSPVLFRDLDKGGFAYRVLGVISNYQAEYFPVLDPKAISPSDITSDDIAKSRIVRKGNQTYRLEDTGKVVSANTGIIVAYGINQAVELIKKNASGPKTSGSFDFWNPVSH
jgi:hypothetical protein